MQNANILICDDDPKHFLHIYYITIYFKFNKFSKIILQLVPMKIHLIAVACLCISAAIVNKFNKWHYLIILH